MDARQNNQPAKLPKMSTPRYEPKVGDIITVTLPDEKTRATIEKLISDTACIARLNTFTMSKSHQYRKGDLVPCKYETLSMHLKGWRVVPQRELDESSARVAEKRKGK